MIRYKCIKCDTDLESPDSIVGQDEQCPVCKTVNRIPQPLRLRCPHCPGEVFSHTDLTSGMAMCPKCGKILPLKGALPVAQIAGLTRTPGVVPGAVQKGRMIIAYPTGTGKTLIQAEIIKRCYQDKGFKCAMILSPYILLTYQHLKEIADHLIAQGINAEYLNISSGSFDDAEIREAENAVGWTASPVESTTSPDRIKAVYDTAMAAGKLLVISSTYHSAMRVRDAGVKPDLQMNDEAHFMCNDSGKYAECLDISERSYSFTATPKSGTPDSPHYMSWQNGKDAQGKQLYIPNPRWGETYYRSPRAMILAGEMMKPVLHIVQTYDGIGDGLGEMSSSAVVKAASTDDISGIMRKTGVSVSQVVATSSQGDTPQQFGDNDYAAMWRCIGQSFNHHAKWLKGESAEPGHIAPKILVTIKDQKTMQGILESPDCQAFMATRPEDFHVFAISSDFGVYIDGVMYGGSMSKGKFLSQLKAVPQTDRAIVLYVDMLNEGIDVPGITGFLPLRAINASRFKQGLGRASRLTPEDRRRFYAHEIQSAAVDWTKYIKPHSAVIVPIAVINSNEWASEYMRIWGDILQECGEFYEFVMSTDKQNKFKEDPAEDAVNMDEIAKLLKISNSGINKFLHYILGDPQCIRMDIDDVCAAELVVRFPDGGIVQRVFDKVGYTHERAQTIRARAIYNKAIGENFERMIKEIRQNSGQGVFAEAIKKKFGTIYTPDHVITATVDLAFKHLDPTLDRTGLKYCDPAAGDGNFFVILYDRLMKDEQFVAKYPDEIERSRQILTQNIWGFEILKAMHLACRMRLVTLHMETCKKVCLKSGKDYRLVCRREVDVVDKLNIYWGNTIKTPQDTGFSPDPKIGEGDFIADAGIRGMKFDVIVGNPPYTHLRNMDNRVYSAYPKQRDMAQLFVRWAMDHLAKNGMCSYNILNTILDKTSDGGYATRRLLLRHVRAVVDSIEIQNYSRDDGGDIATFIIAISSQRCHPFDLNGVPTEYTDNQFLEQGFIRSLSLAGRQRNFATASVSKYGKLVGCKTGNKKGDYFREHLVDLDPAGRYYLMCKRNIGSGSYKGYFKLLRKEDINSFLAEMTESNVRYCEMSHEHAIWVMGYLNCSAAVSNLKETFKNSIAGTDKWLILITTDLWSLLQVPDFDWYKTNKPAQHQAFLNWVRANMGDKAKFLAGIDAEFEKLIAGDDKIQQAQQAPVVIKPTAAPVSTSAQLDDLISSMLPKR